MKSNEQREQLNNIFDLAIEIENQKIAEVSIFYISGNLSLIIKDKNESLLNECVYDPKEYAVYEEILLKVSIGNLNAIPGYSERLNKIRLEKLAKLAELNAEFEAQ